MAPLDRGLANSVFSWVTFFSVVSADFDELFRRHTGLNLTQACILIVLYNNPQGIRIGTCANILRLRPNTTTAAIKSLEAEGLVRRGIDTNDRRASLIFSNEKSNALRPSFHKVLEIYRDSVLTVLDQEEIDQINSLVERMAGYAPLENLAEDAREAAGHLIATRGFIIAANNYVKKYDISLLEARILFYLEYTGRAEKLTDVVNTLCVRQNILTLSINSLEDQGLLQRIQAKKDRRAISLVITDEGHDLITECAESILMNISSKLPGIQNTPPQNVQRLFFKNI